MPDQYVNLGLKYQDGELDFFISPSVSPFPLTNPRVQIRVLPIREYSHRDFRRK